MVGSSGEGLDPAERVIHISSRATPMKYRSKLNRNINMSKVKLNV